MKNIILYSSLFLLLLTSCSQRTDDQKNIETTTKFLIKLNDCNGIKHINIFNEIRNYKGKKVAVAEKGVSFLSCQEIFDRNEVNFYNLKFNHASEKVIHVEVVNNYKLQGFILKFNNGKISKPELRGKSASNDRPDMIYLKQIRKKYPAAAYKYIDDFPRDSIMCR